MTLKDDIKCFIGLYCVRDIGKQLKMMRKCVRLYLKGKGEEVENGVLEMVFQIIGRILKKDCMNPL